MFEDNDLIIASVCDPRFKLSWIEEQDRTLLERATRVVNEEFLRESQNTTQREDTLS